MGRVKPFAEKSNNRLVAVSNRGAYTFSESGGSIEAMPSVSGLVSAIDPVITQEGGAWVAWGGRYGKEGEETGVSLALPEYSKRYFFHEVVLTPEEVALFYEGFANSCLWPLCHSFLEKSVFNEKQWQFYCRANQKFASVVLKITGARDLIWVHDYHLALLPFYLRSRRPQARVSLFWHIPFPPAEIFEVMPWSAEIIKGMLNARLIGFHSKGYVFNFLQSAEKIAGAEVDYREETVYWPGGRTKILAAPVGINWYEFMQLAGKNEVREKAARIRREAGGEYILLGVDRLDYTKGILERLRAVAWLLENHPQYRRRLTFIQIAVPSRTGTPAYQGLKRQIEETVGGVNGIFTEDYHVPVRYICRPLSKTELVAHYLAADMALVTPLKDGLNLVAKEYVAANASGSGVLILSHFAGAADQLKDALTVNPHNIRETASKIVLGLEMPVTEKKRRLAALNRVVRERDVYWWWRKFKHNWLNAVEEGKSVLASDAEQEVLLHEPVAGLAGMDT